MADLKYIDEGETSAVDVLGWVVPRPTGRWHRAIVVTAVHVWITPEITFADNQEMEAAAATGIKSFHDYLQGSGWIKQPERVKLSDVRGINWNETAGWIHIGGAGDEVIGAMIPDRKAGEEIRASAKKAIGSRISATKESS